MRFSNAALFVAAMCLSACAAHQSAANTPINNMPAAPAATNGDWPVASAQGQAGCVLLDPHFLAKYSKEYVVL